MKKILVAVLMAGVVTFAGASLAGAQVGDATVVKVPFSFIVSGKVLPAGSYRITNHGEDTSLLLIASADGRSGTFVETERDGEVPEGTSPHLSFKNYDGHYFLSQVAMAGGQLRAVRLSKMSAEQTLVRLNLMPSERAVGATK